MEKEKEGMIEEVGYAVEFWISHLSTCPKPTPSSEKDKETKEKEAPSLTELDVSCLDIFREELTHLLHERFAGHWYPDDKLRGSAYRSISYDTRMDAIFTKAAEKAGVDRIEDRLEPVRYYIMFINPGEVKVKNTRLWTSEAKYIWSKRGEIDDSGSASPPTSPTSESKSTSRDQSIPSPSSSTNSSPTSTGSSDTRFHSNSPSRLRPRPPPSNESRLTTSSHVAHHHPMRRQPGPSPFRGGASVAPVPRRSPSPPPLSLDQPYATQNNNFSGHSFSPSSSNGTTFRFREPSPGTSHPEPFPQHGPSHGPHGPSHFGGPRVNPISNGASSFSYNKYPYPAPRSRTPSPPLLTAAGTGNGFYRSHSASPARHLGAHHHPSQGHEPPRLHAHHGLQHEYGGNRFLPRYRSMGLTRS